MTKGEDVGLGVVLILLLVMVGLCVTIVLAGCGSESDTCQVVKVTLCSKYDELGGIVDSYESKTGSCKFGYQASHDTRCK